MGEKHLNKLKSNCEVNKVSIYPMRDRCRLHRRQEAKPSVQFEVWLEAAIS